MKIEIGQTDRFHILTLNDTEMAALRAILLHVTWRPLQKEQDNAISQVAADICKASHNMKPPLPKIEAKVIFQLSLLQVEKKIAKIDE